jgi:hypothetical protein
VLFFVVDKALMDGCCGGEVLMTMWWRFDDDDGEWYHTSVA